MKVKVPLDEHANLDSFPFRYGFSFKKTTVLHLFNISNKNNDFYKPNERYHIDASFENPETKEVEKGHFVLLKVTNTVVTVWGLDHDADTEIRLSETLRSARKRGKITVDDLINMHHLKIRNLDQFIDFLANKMSSKEIEKIKEEAHNELEKIRIENKKLKERIEELEKLTEDAHDDRPNEQWNPGIYKLLDVKWGNKGIKNQRAVIVILSDKNNKIIEIANNWEKGLESRFEHATKLIGQKIIYSSLGTHSEIWFMNIKRETDDPVSTKNLSEYQEVKIVSVKIVPGESLKSNWKSKMQLITTDQGEYIDNITNPKQSWLTPGFNWNSLIGKRVNAFINFSQGYEWINFQNEI